MYNGYRVVHVRNITDVGHMRNIGTDGSAGSPQVEQIDPIIEEAIKMGKTPTQIAEHFTKIFLEDEKKLNILPATVYPRASENVKEMIEIIKILLKKALRTRLMVLFILKLKV